MNIKQKLCEVSNFVTIPATIGNSLISTSTKTFHKEFSMSWSLSLVVVSFSSVMYQAAFWRVQSVAIVYSAAWLTSFCKSENDSGGLSGSRRAPPI